MKENIEEDIKDLKAVYSGAIEAGELSIANIIKWGIDLIEKLQEEKEELKEKWDKDTHILQNKLDIVNAKKIELQKENEELKEYKKISELTKISCCTAQNCEALSNAIRNSLENEKLKKENEELKTLIAHKNGYRKQLEQGLYTKENIIPILLESLEEEE